MDIIEIKALINKVLQTDLAEEKEGYREMDNSYYANMDKNTKLELAKALIEKVIGMECVETGDVNCESVRKLDELRTQIYNFNEEVLDEVIKEYRKAFNKLDNVGEN